MNDRSTTRVIQDGEPAEGGQAGETGEAVEAGQSRHRHRVHRVLLAVVAAAVVAAVVFGVTRLESPRTTVASIRVSGIPANVSTSLANLMGISPVKERRGSAPNFTLTDQHGTTVSLSSLRGHPVVLSFLDPHCVTMCPIIAQEFVDAEHHLARDHPRVVFLAVNVNRHALGVATVGAFTKEHQLNTISTWHFLTGSLSALKRVWSQYGVYVETRIVHGQWTVVHTTIDFFIAPNGKERYVAAPRADYRKTATHRAFLPSGTYSAWGRGIALVARDL